MDVVGRAFQSEGTASVNVLRQKTADFIGIAVRAMGFGSKASVQLSEHGEK